MINDIKAANNTFAIIFSVAASTPRESTEPFPIRLMAIDIKREVEAGADRQRT